MEARVGLGRALGAKSAIFNKRLLILQDFSIPAWARVTDQAIDRVFHGAGRDSPPATLPALVVDDTRGVLLQIPGQIADVKDRHFCASFILRPPCRDALEQANESINRLRDLVPTADSDVGAQIDEAVVEFEN